MRAMQRNFEANTNMALVCRLECRVIEKKNEGDTRVRACVRVYISVIISITFCH